MHFDAKNATILAVGGIDEEMHHFILEALHECNKSKKNAITMVFSTLGGDDDQAFGIYDAIVASPKPVTIEVSGPCHSAGTLILQAGVKRLARVNSTFLLHYGIPEYSCIQETEYAKKRDNTWVKIMAQRCGRSFEDMDAIHRTETYWNTDQAVTNGLVDDVVMPKRRVLA